MKKLVLAASALIGALSVSAPASAGIYADDLARCVVKSASDADQVILVRWIFGAMASHDAVRPLAAVSPAQHAELNRTGAVLFQRLLLQDCRKETVAAVKYEGEAAIAGSFTVLGQVAMRGLMTDPKVAATLGGMTESIDKKQWEAFAKEAGLPTK